MSSPQIGGKDHEKTMVISFIAAAMLLIPCTACHVAESHNEVLAQENKENTVNGGYTITDITDPVEVQSYIEQQGGEYTADIMAVHQVTFTDYTAKRHYRSGRNQSLSGKSGARNITRILPLFIRLLSLTGKRHQRVPLCEVEK